MKLCFSSFCSNFYLDVIRGIHVIAGAKKAQKGRRKEPAFICLAKYGIEKSGKKTTRLMWLFLKKIFQKAELNGEKIIEGYDFVYETNINRFTVYFQNKRKPIDIGFRTFQRYISDLKRELKKKSQ
jgi:hypothetical protein